MPVVRTWERHFTPDDDVRSLVDGFPKVASKTLDVEIYTFTDPVLADALIAAAGRGVAVRVMADSSQTENPRNVLQKVILQRLVKAGVPVRSVTSIKHRIDHLKHMIRDGAWVLTGSYNFTLAAQAQDNFVDVTNDPGMVAAHAAKFVEDWAKNPQVPI